MRRRTYSAGPNAIDPASGFKVKLDRLERQWDNELVDRAFIDKERNPQDYLRAIPDRQVLPYSRPEAPDRFMAYAFEEETGVPISLEDGGPLQTEG